VIKISFLGVYNSTGGIQLSFLGVYNSTGGIQISFLGVYNSTGGIQISFQGVTTNFFKSILMFNSLHINNLFFKILIGMGNIQIHFTETFYVFRLLKSITAI